MQTVTTKVKSAFSVMVEVSNFDGSKGYCPLNNLYHDLGEE